MMKWSVVASMLRLFARFSNQVFICAVSLGGLESLLVHPASMIHTHQSEDQKAAAGISVGLLRMSVGVEELSDLQADLVQAFDGLA